MFGNIFGSKNWLVVVLLPMRNKNVCLALIWGKKKRSLTGEFAISAYEIFNRWKSFVPTFYSAIKAVTSSQLMGLTNGVSSSLKVFENKIGQRF